MVDIRPLDAMDRVFLEEMLLEAFFWDPAWPRPTLAEFREHPEFTKLLADWGRPGDRGVVAEEQQSKTGAAWFRLWRSELHSYGFVDAETPELGIAVASAHRSKGVGRTLLRALIEIARADGYPALSLSVSPSNYARLSTSRRVSTRLANRARRGLSCFNSAERLAKALPNTPLQPTSPSGGADLIGLRPASGARS